MIENLVPCHLHDITSLNHNDNKLFNSELVFALCNNTAFDLCLLCSNVGVVIFVNMEVMVLMRVYHDRIPLVMLLLSSSSRLLSPCYANKVIIVFQRVGTGGYIWSSMLL